MEIGARYLGNGVCEFVVWGPFLKEAGVKIISPSERIIPMTKDNKGYWNVRIEEVYPGTRYYYRLAKEKERPDPASCFQPEGVHQPSQVVDLNSFKWEDETWNGKELSEFIMYELHVGTFTKQGTFDAIIPRLAELKDMGINAIQLMPVAQFPGERNWGYDGVYLFAVQNSYGGPQGLMNLVNACHKQGISVILDVVYNHLGPEGNYLEEYGPYFTEKYKTPWGKAVNFDEAYSDEVRNFFIRNVLYWFRYYHIDALRLDAIHGIYDMSAQHVLEEMAENVFAFSQGKKRKYYLIAESNLNDVRIIKPKELGGYGIDSQWSDDFHHSLHTLLTGEKNGYYCDFGKIEHLVKSLCEGFVYTGQYSLFRKRRHGNTSLDRPAKQFVVSSQNHDQVGNRMLGERLPSLISFEALKLAAGAVLLSPYIPLLFMGEEYGEDAPFLYFVHHSDQHLIESVRKGRKREFRTFRWKGEPPDPQSEETFLKSKLQWEKRKRGNHKILLEFYKRLITLRNNVSALSNLDKNNLSVSGDEENKIVLFKRWGRDSCVWSIFNFNAKDITITSPMSEGGWKRSLDSSDTIWGGPGSLFQKKTTKNKPNQIDVRKQSFMVFIRE